MSKFDVTVEGTTYEVDAPDERTAWSWANKTHRQAAQPPAPAGGPDRGWSGAAGDLLAGAVRGAGSIGATLLTPVDAAARALGIQNDFIGRTDRREAMDGGLRELGADTDSLAFKGGNIVAEIAGTAGAGGVLAKGAQAAGAAPMLVHALRSAGMSAGGATGAGAMGARVGAGALTGAASAGLVNPEDAGTGAIIGGALPLAGAAVQGLRRGNRAIVGATTGAGDEALRVAYESGKAGGGTAQAFKDNMRGNADISQVLDDARGAVAQMRANRAAEYRSNMAAVQADQTVLDMRPIQQAVRDSIDNFTFKGYAKNPKVLEKLGEVSDEVAKWRQLPPADYHTPEGLDALKQRIGAIMESVPFEARDVRSAISKVYNGVKAQISAQAPEYSKTMRDYHQASELLDEITRSLSLGERTTADTALRKLQSVLRNNANTNYGARVASMQALEQQGGRELMPALAGQALNDWMPRGIQRATGPGLSIATAMAGNPLAAAGNFAISSPRLMGEAAYLSGTASRKLDPLIKALRRSTYLGAPVVGAQ